MAVKSQSALSLSTCVVVSLTDVPGARDRTGLGQIWEGSSGKSGSGRRAHLSVSSPRGPGLINCWSRVQLAAAPSRPWRPSVQVSREELLLPQDCDFLCPGVRVPGGLGAEPDVGFPSNARSGWRRPRGPSLAVWLPEATNVASPQLHHVGGLLPTAGVDSPDGVAHVHPAEDELFARRLF